MFNNIKRSFFTLTIIAVVFSSTIFSCRKDDAVSTDSASKLNFSADTVIFDTVFTTLGSITKQLKVYNNNSQKLKISSIKLGKGASSMFRINVDGTSGYQVNDVEIAPHDSLYIFVKVTINPNNQSNPLIVSDSVVFVTNGNLQNVQLVAWGQDAYYHVPNHRINFSDGTYLSYSIADCSVPWPTDKPHVIYGYCVVDSATTLNLQAGTKLYFAPNGVLWVYKFGTLKVYGAQSNPVTFQGSRLDAFYKDLPGQWGKIWLSDSSINNEINYAVIKNGNIGIQIDDNINSNATLLLNNTIIDNMSVAGIFAQTARIEATNTVVSNSGQYSIVLSIGGDYQFFQCTIGNFWSYNFRQTPSVVLNNYYKDINDVIHKPPLIRATFGNCIIYGNNEEELLLDSIIGGTFNYKFDHCLIKTQFNTSGTTKFIGCKINIDPLFTDITSTPADLTLTTNSPAIGAGSNQYSAIVLTDITGHNYAVPPSIGAYEKGSKK